ncbi:MAG: hypothetical protein AVDCRST_MAG49-728, partial [uncultured Thermomicrobiales bacterium]
MPCPSPEVTTVDPDPVCPVLALAAVRPGRRGPDACTARRPAQRRRGVPGATPATVAVRLLAPPRGATAPR